MQKNVLFIDSVHDILEQRLIAAGYTCHHEYRMSRDEIKKILPNYIGIVTRSRITLDEDFLVHATQLQWIARSGSGLENIDLTYTAHRGIHVYNSPEGNRDAVGEHAIAMLLALFNRIISADAEVRKGIWLREENRGLELSGKTVGLIGYGQMGSGMAKKLSGFNCRVIAYDKYKSGFTGHDVLEVTQSQLFEESDIVSLHVPLTEETRYLVNDEFIAQFKKPFFLINTSRGKNADTAAIVRGLQSGKIRGACLDVLEYEKASLEGLDFTSLPEPLQYLYASEKVILSPHVAGWTVESYEKLSSVLAEKILSKV